MVRQIRGQILDLIQDRFDKLDVGGFEFGPRNWPTVWVYENHDRDMFLRDVRWFSSNHDRQFGLLLTPLVNGVRVRGMFAPRVAQLQLATKLVLIDGEGLGHRDSSVQSISTKVTERFSEVDQIVLVDSATQPMVGAPLLLLRTILDLGQIAKLAVAFTHFDQVKGDNLRSHVLKIEHVRGAIDSALATLRTTDSATTPELSRLEAQLQSNSFFLGGLDRDTSQIQQGYLSGSRDDNLHALIRGMRDGTLTPETVGATFQLDYTEIGRVLEDAIAQFRALWQARLEGDPSFDRQKEHWTRIKALNRRLAEMGESEYGTLRPIAEFLRYLRRNLSAWVETAATWPEDTDTEESHNIALDTFRQTIGAQTHNLVKKRIWADQLDGWVQAYDQRGKGSTFVRAYLLNEIYEKAAPIKSDPEIFVAEVIDIVEVDEDELRSRLETATDHA